VNGERDASGVAGIPRTVVRHSLNRVLAVGSGGQVPIELHGSTVEACNWLSIEKQLDSRYSRFVRGVDRYRYRRDRNPWSHESDIGTGDVIRDDDRTLGGNNPLVTKDGTSLHSVPSIRDTGGVPGRSAVSPPARLR
jgi:hypothetical protein